MVAAHPVAGARLEPLQPQPKEPLPNLIVVRREHVELEALPDLLKKREKIFVIKKVVIKY